VSREADASRLTALLPVHARSGIAVAVPRFFLLNAGGVCFCRCALAVQEQCLVGERQCFLQLCLSDGTLFPSLRHFVSIAEALYFHR